MGSFWATPEAELGLEGDILKTPLFFICPSFPSVFSPPFLSLPFTSSCWFLFLPHPFLLKMERRPALWLC